MKQWPLLKMQLRFEEDVVAARQRARQVAQQLGLDPQDQIRVAAAASELTRNAFVHAGGGTVEFLLEEGEQPPQVLLIRISDSGPGIADLDSVLYGGGTTSAENSALGLVGARKLVDSFHIDSDPRQGTTVTIRKARPASSTPLSRAQLNHIIDTIVSSQQRTPVDELRQQNDELLTALEALERNQQELLRLNQELEDTNRGVVALYAELDEKAKELHRANQVKSRFLAHMSHEFRTPLNSVLALSRLLLSHADGELGEEQTRQVVFIRRAASELLEMVNDLLDLAKVEAGTMTVQVSEVNVSDLMSALRGMFLPLVVAPDVALVFSGSDALPVLRTDERKVTQILRNFIANALKFTSEGEIRVGARLSADSREIIFSVSDTGIGIPPEEQEHIFEEFRQASSPFQQKTLGSGLGLAISRKLAQLMYGTVGVRSTPGEGATFWLRIPVGQPEAAAASATTSPASTAGQSKVLVVDDNEIDRYILRGLLTDLGYEVVEASDGLEGLELATRIDPDAVFLDLMMPGTNGFDVLERIRATPEVSEQAVVVITSKSLDEGEVSRLRDLGAFLLPKSYYSTGDASSKVRTALAQAFDWRSERAS